MILCAVLVLFLVFVSIAVCADSGPTPWKTIAVILWSAVAALVLGMLFGLASYGAREDRS